MKSVALDALRLQFLGDRKDARDLRQFGVKGGVETRRLRKPGKMLLREADDRQGRGHMQRREGGRGFELRRTASSIRQCCRSFGPPCTMRCPMAAGAGILASARSFPMRMIASRWSGMDAVSESNAFPCESCAWNLPSLSPMDSASPESSISIREEPTRYKPNLSEEEPLFSASTFSSDSASVMRIPAEHRAHEVQRQSRTSGMSWPCSLI